MLADDVEMHGNASAVSYNDHVVEIGEMSQPRIGSQIQHAAIIDAKHTLHFAPPSK